jgi:hypothetical protein
LLQVAEGRGRDGQTYDYSTVFRIQKDKCIDLGRMAGGGGKKQLKKINESG